MANRSDFNTFRVNPINDVKRKPFKRVPMEVFIDSLSYFRVLYYRTCLVKEDQVTIVV